MQIDGDPGGYLPPRTAADPAAGWSVEIIPAALERDRVGQPSLKRPGSLATTVCASRPARPDSFAPGHAESKLGIIHARRQKCRPPNPVAIGNVRIGEIARWH